MHGFLFINKQLLISCDTGIYAIINIERPILFIEFLLFQLNLNPMKDAGMEAILKAVENHQCLCLLSLEVRNNHVIMIIGSNCF